MKVLTSNGFQTFEGVKCTKNKELWLVTTDEVALKCTHDHLLERHDSKFRSVANLSVGDRLSNGQVIKSVIKTGDHEDVYDLINVDNGHHYLTNNITSHNCIILDEFAFVEHADIFWTSTYPVISSAETSQVIIISTPNGNNLFQKKYQESIDGTNAFVNYIAKWDRHPNRDEKWKETTIKNIGLRQFNQEYECEFFGSAGTLIEGPFLKSLTWDQPIRETATVEIYENPIPGQIYIVTVDVAEGMGQDASVINVTRINRKIYVQVAILRDIDVRPHLLPRYVIDIATRYNEAEVLVEINSIGDGVAESLWRDYEYENMLLTNKGTVSRRPGYKCGLRMTTKTKRIGTTTLKILIESGIYIIKSHRTLTELNSFVMKTNGTYSAEPGAHDDTVMTLVSFAWLSQQEYFKDLTEIDNNVELYNKYKSQLEEDLVPFGFFSDGTEDEIDLPLLF